MYRVNCNCSRITLIGEVIAFDPNGHGNIERGILINDHQSIWLADEFGCMCHQIVNMSSYNGIKKLLTLSILSIQLVNSGINES